MARRMRKFTNGDRFGMLVVVKTYDPADPSRTVVRCDCGVEKSVIAGSVGHAASCGCVIAQHGMSKTRTYAIWNGMLERCTNPNATGYKYYGGRGIKVCERWRTFENFYADMGERPSPKHSIDRKDNDGNYEPGNVRWATSFQQARNRSNSVKVLVDGVQVPVHEAAETLGVDPRAIYNQRHIQNRKERARSNRRVEPTQEQIERAREEARKLFKRGR